MSIDMLFEISELKLVHHLGMFIRVHEYTLEVSLSMEITMTWIIHISQFYGICGLSIGLWIYHGPLWMFHPTEKFMTLEHPQMLVMDFPVKVRLKSYGHLCLSTLYFQ